MTAAEFTLRSDGSIVLPDDDGDPVYFLAPATAVDLAEFIEDHREQIRAATEKRRTVDAYNLVAALVAGGLPTPNYIRTRWDGALLVELDEDGAFDAWVGALDGTVDTEDHPTLGQRPFLTSYLLRLEGRWQAAAVTA